LLPLWRVVTCAQNICFSNIKLDVQDWLKSENMRKYSYSLLFLICDRYALYTILTCSNLIKYVSTKNTPCKINVAVGFSSKYLSFSVVYIHYTSNRLLLVFLCARMPVYCRCIANRSHMFLEVPQKERDYDGQGSGCDIKSLRWIGPVLMYRASASTRNCALTIQLVYECMNCDTSTNFCTVFHSVQCRCFKWNSLYASKENLIQ